jgi:hypothetical protein
MSDDPNKFKIRKLQAEILGLGSVIRQLRQPGMHHAATQNMRFSRSVFQLTILHIQTDHYHQPRRRPAVHLQISK